jgi:hypothetical protein
LYAVGKRNKLFSLDEEKNGDMNRSSCSAFVIMKIDKNSKLAKLLVASIMADTT